MMKLDYTKDFKKQLNKLPPKKVAKTKQTIDLFLLEPEHPLLRRHFLQAEWAGHESISAGGDLRIHFKISGNTITFAAVGSHS